MPPEPVAGVPVRLANAAESPVIQGAWPEILM
jgi:hypothetical protein